MKKVLFLSIIALTSCLYSCQSKSSRSTDTTTDSITVKEVTIQETYHLSGDTAKPACRIAFAIDVPVKYQQEGDAIRLQKILTPLIFGDEYAPDSLFESSAQKTVASHIAAYKELEPEFEKELKEKTKKGRSKKTEFIPPTFDDVKNYFEGKLPDWEKQAEIFFYHFDALNWKNTNGARIERWDSRANLWIIEKQLQNGNKSTTNNNGGIVSIATGGEASAADPNTVTGSRELDEFINSLPIG